MAKVSPEAKRFEQLETDLKAAKKKFRDQQSVIREKDARISSLETELGKHAAKKDLVEAAATAEKDAKNRASRLEQELKSANQKLAKQADKVAAYDVIQAALKG